MTMKKGIEVSIAIADAAKLVRVEVIAAIHHSQTHIVEHSNSCKWRTEAKIKR